MPRDTADNIDGEIWRCYFLCLQPQRK